MSINDDPKKGIPSVALPSEATSGGDEYGWGVDEGRLTQTQRTRRAQLLHANLERNKAMAAQDFVAFLRVLFVGIKKDNEDGTSNQQGLNNPETSQKIADALGVDHFEFSRLISDVRTGKAQAYDAANVLHSKVDPARVDWSKAGNVKLDELVKREGPTLLNLELLTAMQTDAKIRQMVQWTFEAAEKKGLDGKLLANQFWQESRFNPNAVGPATKYGQAMGLCQFLPSTGAQYGLKSAADLCDPKKAIFAAADYMSDLKNKHGSQQLAMAAYNGGGGAVGFAEKKLGKDVTITEWMAVMQRERQDKGVGGFGAWRNQTFDYVVKIDSAYWSPEKRAAAAAKQDTILREQFSMGGTNQITEPKGKKAFDAALTKTEVGAFTESSLAIGKARVSAADTLTKKPAPTT